ncbi:survival of motor neuron protein-like isoform X2 [Denticeps clupeoides]|uniref:survival of motor neuron protein-like isoform X2 n=1 Tax=Denticeps clupeoides TaxID=299321 RepID=UPI0010A357C5|nr:survival of motor neuron protein-like isoform X2 [Denticeps clupeoides]
MNTFTKSVVTSPDRVDDENREACEAEQWDDSPKGSINTDNAHWTAGSPCRARWPGDGLLYPATLVCVDGERATVRYEGYGNEQELELNALLPGEVWAEQQQWVVGSRCCAVWSEDGLVYPAVLVWIKGSRCRVQFEFYGNEEETDLSTLLPPGNLAFNEDFEQDIQGVFLPVGICGPKGNERKMSEDIALFLPSFNHCQNNTKPLAFNPRAQKNIDNGSSDSEKQNRPSQPLPFFPPLTPFTALLEDMSGQPLLPPPFPPCKGSPLASGGSDADATPLTSLLLSWYLCGFHAGCYTMTMQPQNSPEMADKGIPKAKFCYYEQ